MRVLVFGTFDNLHPGHMFLLHEAEARGELWVIVARDNTVEKLKGKTPTQSEDERKEALESALPNAHILLGDTEDYFTPVKEIAPDLILLGYDQQLPPGVKFDDFSCPVERVKPHKPEQYKSSLLREDQ